MWQTLTRHSNKGAGTNVLQTRLTSLQQPQAHKPFKAELKVLNNIKHPTETSKKEEAEVAPIFTRAAHALRQSALRHYGLLGEITKLHGPGSKKVSKDPRVYFNTNSPSSVVVCGVQGSGKSHTVAALLENAMITKCPSIGSSIKPLSALVLHLGEAGSSTFPCEAAWVGVKGDTASGRFNTPNVRVFVPPSSLERMKRVYVTSHNEIEVEPLLFAESELDAQAFLSMMAVGSAASAPLYMQIVLSVLRDLGDHFTYDGFRARLADWDEDFNSDQRSSLRQRLRLLESFMHKDKTKKKSRFAAGQITVVDLTDPFIDHSSACGIFEIVTRLFVRADVGTGKVLVVDEAHKYLSQDPSACGLTNSLVSLTRQMRHLGLRVIISTQEPTIIPPVLLDLCSVAILHRFSSPSWWDHLSRHLAGSFDRAATLNEIVTLRPGQALVLSPSGLIASDEFSASAGGKSSPSQLEHFGRRYSTVNVRARVTQDKGGSIVVV